MREDVPCRKCGSTKTGSVRHGLMHKLAKAFGYHLRSCGGCHRLRLIRRHTDAEPEVMARPMGEVRKVTKGSNKYGCPYCGSEDLRRSHRRWYERVLGRPKMMRCKNCRRRFHRRLVTSPYDRETVTRKSA